MAAMTTALIEFADNGDSRTYALSNHTALKPRLLIQKRKVPAGNSIVAETTAEVLYSTVDSDGMVLPQKIGFKVSVRFPVTGLQADIDAALVVFRDVIAGDEFGNAVNTQEYLV
jgi:hypothetical protein